MLDHFLVISLFIIIVHYIFERWQYNLYPILSTWFELSHLLLSSQSTTLLHFVFLTTPQFGCWKKNEEWVGFEQRTSQSPWEHSIHYTTL